MATRTLWRLAALALAVSGSTLLVACGGGGTDEVDSTTPLNATLLIKSDPASGAAACSADSTGNCAPAAR